MSYEKGGAPLPKFGEWDVNNPASAEGFTVIFNKARDDKKTGRDASTASPPTHNNGAKASNGRTYTNNKQSAAGSPKPTSKKWLCCV